METKEVLRLVKLFFVKENWGNGNRYVVNDTLALKFSGDQEAARFLVKVIRFWCDKQTIFCFDYRTKQENGKSVLLLENEWTFSLCSNGEMGTSCWRTSRILDKIFEDGKKFVALPFVGYSSTLRFNLLKDFAKNGRDSVLRLIKKEARKREVADRKAERKIAIQEATGQYCEAARALRKCGVNPARIKVSDSQ